MNEVDVIAFVSKHVMYIFKFNIIIIYIIDKIVLKQFLISISSSNNVIR